MNIRKSSRIVIFILAFLVLLCIFMLVIDLFLPSFNSFIKEDIQTECSNNIVFININTADVNALISLPKIGNVIANRIIEYRTVNGPFNTKEEILNVPGIGNSIFDLIKEYIVV